MNTDVTGRTLAGRYQIERALGEETLGQVWLARDLRTARLVSVKVLPAALADEPERFVRFAREMKASFLVTHPNTAEVLDYGDEDGAYYLVLEYLACRTLAAELAQQERLPVHRVAAIGAQIAHALGAAHQEGIVHRALSPSTVVLLDNAEADYVKVRDFGTSKLDRGGEDEPEVTASDIRLGEAEYMAPEYIETGKFHPKGDLYALGALLFHLVAGRPPFEGERDRQIEQHVATAPPRLRSVAPDTPEWLDALVNDLLTKKPADRPGVFKIVQRLEDGVGHPLVVPKLLPLDAEGVPIRPARPAAGAGWTARLVALVALLTVGGVGAAVVLVGAAAVVALVLSLPAS